MAGIVCTSLSTGMNHPFVPLRTEFWFMLDCSGHSGRFRWILVGRTVSASIEKCIIFFFTILILSSLMTVIYMNKPTYGTHHHFVVVWTHPAACPFLASSLCFNLCSSLLHFFLFFGLSIFPPIFSVCFVFLTFIFHFFVLWATTQD